VKYSGISALICFVHTTIAEIVVYRLSAVQAGCLGIREVSPSLASGFRIVT
jgi:hypothetical protein